jgi:hypothetical protein
VWRPAVRLPLSPSEQAILEAVAASTEIPTRIRKRAGIILSAAEGVPNNRIAHDLSTNQAYVLRWRNCFLAHGIRGLWDVERIPPQERIPEAVEQAVVFDCLYRSRVNMLPPWDGEPSLRWNVRNLALRHGISRASVGRIRKRHGIQTACLNGIDLGKLKISPDPLFAVTVYQIGGLLYETVGPALSFCSTARPFSELSFSSLPAAGRKCLIDRLVGEFRKLERRRHDSFYAKLSDKESLDPPIDRFVRFVMVIAAKHAEAQNHLLLHWGAHEYPSVQKWLAKQPRIQLHDAPMAPPNGPQWTELTEHWLKVIAGWPMQASLVESVKRMTEILKTCPPDQLDQLVII